jgi:hypothetical protein
MQAAIVDSIESVVNQRTIEEQRDPSSCFSVEAGYNAAIIVPLLIGEPYYAAVIDFNLFEHYNNHLKDSRPNETLAVAIVITTVSKN